MIVLKELFNNIKRTNLRILLLWIILTQVIMFGLYIQLLRFTANREFRTVTKGPRLPNTESFISNLDAMTSESENPGQDDRVVQDAFKLLNENPKTNKPIEINEIMFGDDLILAAELPDSDISQWNNSESMLYLKYARAEDETQFNQCNIKYSFDILEDVLTVKNSNLMLENQSLDDQLDSILTPLNTPIFELSLNSEFLNKSFKDVPKLASRLCLIQKFDKRFNVTESFDSLGRIIKLYKQNNYFARIKKAGFYELRCYYLKDEPNVYKRFYSDVFTILPKDMRELNVKRDQHKTIIKKEKIFDDFMMKNEIFSDVKLSNCLSDQIEINKIENRKKMNVFILTLGSVAKNHFKRIFPTTYKYLTEELPDNIFYERFNKIGENAYPNIVPMFTGLVIDSNKELNITNELNVYKKIDSTFHDYFPFIWHEYETIGYLTQYNEENSKLGIFNLNRKGFRYPPTSLYNQPFNLKLEDIHRPVKCYQNQPVYEKILKDINRFMIHMNSNINRDIPYFSFNFMKYLTHTFLTVPKSFDIQLKNLIAEFFNQKFLDNALFILMSDHGSRLTKYSYQSKVGRAERSTPFFSMHLPKRLIGTEFHKNAINNKDKIFTAHDVYKTLKHFYYLNQNVNHNSSIYSPKCRKEFANSDRQTRSLRGISLFEKHPENRSCFDALIPVLFCENKKVTQLTEKEFLEQSGSSVMVAGDYVLNRVNNLTSVEREKCSKFEIEKIMPVRAVTDSFYKLFLINLILKPGNAVFEAYLKIDSEKKLKIYNKIMRVNDYKKQSKCVDKRSLKGFCYCKEKI